MTVRYPVPELKDLPEDIRAKVLEVQEKAGFVPHIPRRVFFHRLSHFQTNQQPQTKKTKPQTT